MSFAYDIRNLKDCADYKTKRADFFKTLHLQQKLNRNYEQAMNQRSQMEKLGIQPVGETPRSLEDEKKDLLLQQNLLLKNLQTVTKAEEARKLLFLLSPQEIYDFNSNFPAVAEALKGRTNLSADFLKRVFRRYMLVLQATGGTGIPIPLSEETLSKLPGDLVDGWQNYARGMIDPETGGILSIDDLIKRTAEVLNRPPQDVEQEVKMEIDADIQDDTPLEQFVKRKRGEAEEVGRKKPKREMDMGTQADERGIKRVMEQELFTLPVKKPKVSEETKGSLKRRKEEETEIIQQAIKRSKEGPGPDPLPFRRGQKRLSRTTLEAELVKRQKMTEMSKKRPAERELRGQPTQKKVKEAPLPGRNALKETYLSPTELQLPLEEAFMGYEPVSILEEAKAQATRDIKRRATKRAKELTAAKKETALQKAKREAKEAIAQRAEARARELGQGLFISPQRSSADYKFITNPETGGGFKGRSKIYNRQTKMYYGAGIGESVQEQKYRQFGKYVLYMPSLHKGILHVKYPCLMAIGNFPKKVISNKLRDFLFKLVVDGIADKSLYNELDIDDQEYFIKLARRCEFDSNMGLGNQIYKHSPKEEEELKRFELLKGTVIAGNNDPEVMKELKHYVVKFIHDGQISKAFGHSLLYEMACLA